MRPSHKQLTLTRVGDSWRTIRIPLTALTLAIFMSVLACSNDSDKRVQASGPKVTVGVTKVVKKSLGTSITLSSELVPFQEIDVYAKESGYVKKLMVDYGTHVKAGQLIAILEIPELEAQLQEDEAEIKNAANQMTRAQHELERSQAQYKALHLEYTRLNGVFQSQPGIVAQQEVDDAQGKDLAASSQVDASQAALDAAQSQVGAAKAKLVHDQTLFDYSRITAPFTGVVTQRYANLGTLVQAGTTSTQAMPIVKLSEDDLYRLVIPVPESYVHFVRVGDPVDVHVPSLNKTFPGTVARFSAGVREDTRTMHTEVDVKNKGGSLVPGIYAQADLTLEHRDDVPTIPLQALNHEGEKTTVFVVSNDQIEDRAVELGIQTATDAEVVSGLKEGEEIVVSDRGGLKPGDRVHPQIVQVMQYHENNQE
ncbi:MAG TPA: efflux RND transporter periplasmic adaptor subunit [Candidatus Sulfotelmatobacter sp.]|nr:efflux RND transporter periplasmic adaptor subunit [Candidatus Sulfotelmatobacter sp.]